MKISRKIKGLRKPSLSRKAKQRKKIANDMAVHLREKTTHGSKPRSTAVR